MSFAVVRSHWQLRSHSRYREMEEFRSNQAMQLTAFPVRLYTKAWRSELGAWRSRGEGRS